MVRKGGVDFALLVSWEGFACCPLMLPGVRIGSLKGRLYRHVTSSVSKRTRMEEMHSFLHCRCPRRTGMGATRSGRGKPGGSLQAAQAPPMLLCPQASATVQHAGMRPGSAASWASPVRRCCGAHSAGPSMILRRNTSSLRASLYLRSNCFLTTLLLAWVAFVTWRMAGDVRGAVSVWLPG